MTDGKTLNAVGNEIIPIATYGGSMPVLLGVIYAELEICSTTDFLHYTPILVTPVLELQDLSDQVTR